MGFVGWAISARIQPMFPEYAPSTLKKMYRQLQGPEYDLSPKTIFTHARDVKFNLWLLKYCQVVRHWLTDVVPRSSLVEILLYEPYYNYLKQLNLTRYESYYVRNPPSPVLSTKSGKPYVFKLYRYGHFMAIYHGSLLPKPELLDELEAMVIV